MSRSNASPAPDSDDRVTTGGSAVANAPLSMPSGVMVEEWSDARRRPIVAVRAPDGTLVVEYRPLDGTCRIHAPRVEVDATRDLDLHAGERVRVAAGTELTLSCGETQFALSADHARVEVQTLEVATTRTRWTARTFALVSDTVETEARRIVQRAGELETNAKRIVERAREAYRDVEGLAQTHAGRLRLVAEETLHAMGRRTLLKAREDMKLRGERIDLS